MKAVSEKMPAWLSATLLVVTGAAVQPAPAATAVAAAGSQIVRTYLAAPPDPNDTREEGLDGLVFGRDGFTIVTGSTKYGGDVAVRVWDLRHADALPVELGGHVGPLDAVSISDDGRLLATGDYDGTIRLWSLKPQPMKTASFQWFRYQVNALALSPRGDRLAASGDSGVIGLLDLNRPSRAPVVLRGHENLVSRLAFSPDGRFLASSSADGTTRVWPVGDAAADPVILRGHQADLHPVNKNYDQNHVRQVVFTPDGNSLIAGAGDGSVQIWDANQLSNSPRLLKAHDGGVDAIAVDEGSTQLATAGRDHKIRVWNLARIDGTPRLVIDCGQAWASQLAFDPTGTYLAAVIDGVVQLFRVQPVVPETIKIGQREVRHLSAEIRSPA